MRSPLVAAPGRRCDRTSLDVRIWPSADIGDCAASADRIAKCPPLAAGSTGRRSTPVLKRKDGVYDETSRVFSSLHCGCETVDFGIAGSAHKTLGFKPQQKESDRVPRRAVESIAQSGH